MQYRKLGRTGLDVSIIGLGMEHLSSRETIEPVVHHALEAGINYIDLMIWRAEVKDSFAATLRGRRKGIVLAGHLGVAETRGQYRRTRNVAECEALWNDWLARLGTDYIDVLHITYLDLPADLRQVLRPGGVMELAKRLQREGKARFISLSGHSPEVATRAIEDGHLDVVMHPVHIGTASNSNVAALCALCASHGVGLAAMKPFAGGDLLGREQPLSPVQCLHYTLSQTGVSTAVTGVKSVSELDADLAYLHASDEQKDHAAALEEFRQGLHGTCVYCNHCLPCPAEIDIAAIMRMLSGALRWGVNAELRTDYDRLAVQASACIECGECTQRCPFGVEVVASMRKAVELLGS